MSKLKKLVQRSLGKHYDEVRYVGNGLFMTTAPLWAGEQDLLWFNLTKRDKSIVLALDSQTLQPQEQFSGPFFPPEETIGIVNGYIFQLTSRDKQGEPIRKKKGEGWIQPSIHKIDLHSNRENSDSVIRLPRLVLTQDEKHRGCDSVFTTALVDSNEQLISYSAALYPHHRTHRRFLITKKTPGKRPVTVESSYTSNSTGDMRIVHSPQTGISYFVDSQHAGSFLSVQILMMDVHGQLSLKQSSTNNLPWNTVQDAAIDPKTNNLWLLCNESDKGLYILEHSSKMFYPFSESFQKFGDPIPIPGFNRTGNSDIQYRMAFNSEGILSVADFKSFRVNSYEIDR